MPATIAQVINLSGDAQFLASAGSGEALVALKGYDYESGEWRKVRVTGSGEIAIEVTVADIVSLASGTGPVLARVSGESVRLEGYDYESGQWRKVRVTASGEIAIEVTVADIVTAKISGETVYLASGTGPVWAKISGETVTVVSGQVVQLASGTGPVWNKISGETVQLASGTGPVWAKISGETVTVVSGQVIQLASGTGPVWNKISGETVQLASGTGPVWAKISGETVSLPSTQVVKISGEVVKLSGETLQVLSPSTILAGYTLIAASSGGTQLSSGVIVLAKVRNLPGNDNMWLGPIGVLSGTGYLLQGGEHDEFEMGNLNAIYCIAATSGSYVSFRGVN